MSTGIEWTDETWNPLAGCSRVSQGCKHCYAETMAKRLQAMGVAKYQGVVDERGHWTGKINLDEAALGIPLKWKKSRVIFVNSMSDLFHEAVPDAFIDRVFGVMALCPQHTFIVLTKRAERMADYAPATPLPNVVLGVSVENQAAADERIPHLLQTPAACRVISAEPLLGPVDLVTPSVCGCGDSRLYCPGCDEYLIHGVIVGGESGPGARPMHPDWVRGIRDQCEAAGVSFFFKQWGEWIGIDQAINQRRYSTYENEKDRKTMQKFNHTWYVRLGKKCAGRVLDGRKWDDLPWQAQKGKEGYERRA